MAFWRCKCDFEDLEDCDCVCPDPWNWERWHNRPRTQLEAVLDALADQLAYDLYAPNPLGQCRIVGLSEMTS